MENENSLDFLLNENELLHLYSWLKCLEHELDVPLIRLLAKVEKKLYEKLTIQEIENLKIKRNFSKQ